MNQVLLIVLALAFLVAVIIFIVVLLDLRRTLKSAKVFLDAVESEVRPTLTEFQKSLKSVRNLTENVTEVAEDFRTLSESVRGVGEDVKSVSESVRRTGQIVQSLTSSTAAEASGLKAGIVTGLGVFIKSLLRKDQREAKSQF